MIINIPEIKILLKYGNHNYDEIEAPLHYLANAISILLGCGGLDAAIEFLKKMKCELKNGNDILYENYLDQNKHYTEEVPVDFYSNAQKYYLILKDYANEMLCNMAKVNNMDFCDDLKPAEIHEILINTLVEMCYNYRKAIKRGIYNETGSDAVVGAYYEYRKCFARSTT